jgi:hypothetical protein
MYETEVSDPAAQKLYRKKKKIHSFKCSTSSMKSVKKHNNLEHPGIETQKRRD